MKAWSSPRQIREPAVAGRFYSADKKRLENDLKDLFEKAENPVREKVAPIALISPHAGYMFSGSVAASAYNQIPPRHPYKKVFVLASSHRMYFKGASVYPEGDYKTPLGIVKTDSEVALGLIKASPLFIDKPEAHEPEHSIEVQLPFLQHRLGNDFLLVPIVIGTNSAAHCREIAKALEPYFIPENFFVASTDFSHYPSYNDAKNIDAQTAASILLNNPGKLIETLENNREEGINNLDTSLCGWTSVLTLISLTAAKNCEYRGIAYQNSGDSELYGDKKRVVGYWAIAVYFTSDLPFDLNSEEKELLLETARNSLRRFYALGEVSDEVAIPPGSVLNSNMGAFVSLYNGNELRGCIGRFPGETPLAKVVEDMAVSAANDRRFRSPDEKELGELAIEISVLTPLRKITSKNEIELGRHGIYIRKGFNSGTFLPQVATKTGWGVDEFLGRCSRDKAGLGWDGWKTSELFVYEALVFKGEFDPKI